MTHITIRVMRAVRMGNSGVCARLYQHRIDSVKVATCHVLIASIGLQYERYDSTKVQHPCSYSLQDSRVHILGSPPP